MVGLPRRADGGGAGVLIDADPLSLSELARVLGIIVQRI